MGSGLVESLRSLLKPGGTGSSGGLGRGRHAMPPLAGESVADRHGRFATSPVAIPPRGWWAVLKRVWQQNNEDNLGVLAAGCAFYTLLAIFPAMTALVAIYGIYADPADVGGQLATAAPLLPPAAFQLISERLNALTSTGATQLGWGAAFGIALALYSAMAGTKAVFSALNIVYEEREKRSFFAFNLQALVFTLGSILALIVTLSLVVGLPAVLGLVGLDRLVDLVLRLTRWPLLAALVMLAISVVYRFGPSRRAARWRWISPGAVFATLLWIVASIEFSWYVANFASYDKTYGSLGAVVILLLWLWVSTYVVLLGGELNAELELQTARDTTVGRDDPVGRRGAFVADNVAANS